MNIKLTISYDGAGYHGWQVQPHVPTVQGVLKAAIERVVHHPVNLHGASRTDAGVHAEGQVANFNTDRKLPAKKIGLAINSRCPKDICILRAVEVPDDFHASRDAKAKLYRYRIHNATDKPVHLIGKIYHYWRELDVQKMTEAAGVLVGSHDFVGFAASSDKRASTIRQICRLEVYRKNPQVIFEVEGDGFLYNMVRNIVGTLLEIGRGHWSVERVSEILSTCDRRLAGPTVPAAGLTLMCVKY